MNTWIVTRIERPWPFRSTVLEIGSWWSPIEDLAGGSRDTSPHRLPYSGIIVGAISIIAALVAYAGMDIVEYGRWGSFGGDEGLGEAVVMRPSRRRACFPYYEGPDMKLCFCELHQSNIEYVFNKSHSSLGSFLRLRRGRLWPDSRYAHAWRGFPSRLLIPLLAYSSYHTNFGLSSEGIIITFSAYILGRTHYGLLAVGESASVIVRGACLLLILNLWHRAVFAQHKFS